MFNLHHRLVCVGMSAMCLLALAGCGGGAASLATPTPLPLSVFSYESVCRQGPIGEAATYTSGVDGPNPIVLFARDGTDSNTYSFSGNISFKLPEPWVVNYDGDATRVQLVGCITRTAATPVDTCESKDEDDANKVYTLNTHDATYEVKLYEAKTGKEVATTSIDAAYGDCPMMSLFSDDETQKDGFAALNGADLQAFLTEYVAP